VGYVGSPEQREEEILKFPRLLSIYTQEGSGLPLLKVEFIFKVKNLELLLK
jgi:hypothetical protein